MIKTEVFCLEIHFYVWIIRIHHRRQNQNHH